MNARGGTRAIVYAAGLLFVITTTGGPAGAAVSSDPVDPQQPSSVSWTVTEPPLEPAQPPDRRASTSTSISAHPRTAIERERVKITGKVKSRRFARPVTLQRRTPRGWATLDRAKSSRSGAFSFTTRAPAAASVTFRVYAKGIKTRKLPSRTTRRISVTVVKQSVSLKMPGVIQEGAGLTAQAYGSPARPGRIVELQRQTSAGWVPVASHAQDVDGVATLELEEPLPGTFRAVSLPHRGARDVTSAEHDLSIHYITRVATVTPDRGTVLGGDVLILRGKGLSTVESISFAGEPGLDLTVVGDEEVHVRTPLGYPGAAPLILTMADDSVVDTGLSFHFAAPAPEANVEGTLAEGTRSVSRSDLLAVARTESGSTTLTLRLPVEEAPPVGTIVEMPPGTGHLPGGLVGRVDSVDGGDEPGTSLITASGASLDSAFDELTVESAGPVDLDDAALSLRHSGARTVLRRDRVVVARTTSGGLTGGKELFVCRDPETNQIRNDLVESLEIGVRFENTTHTFQLDPGRPFGDPYVNVGIWTEPVISVTGKLKAALTCGLNPQIAENAFPAVSVPGTPLTLDVGPYFDVEFSVEGSISHQQRLYRGYSFIKQGDNPGHSRWSSSADDPTLTAAVQGGIRISGGGFWELAAYDRVGVRATIGMYADGSFSFSGPPPTFACTVEIGFDASVSLFLDAWVARWEYQLAGADFPWATWELCPGPPDPGQVSITTTTLPEAVVGQDYFAPMLTDDDRQGRWRIAGGTLPTGLRLESATGVIRGTPTATGSHSIVVSFTDHYGHTDEQPLTLTVIAGFAPSGFTSTAIVPALPEDAKTAGQGSPLTIISCAKAPPHFCVASGEYVRTDSSYQPYLVVDDGTDSHVLTLPRGEGTITRVQGLSCPEPGWCALWGAEIGGSSHVLVLDDGVLTDLGDVVVTGLATDGSYTSIASLSCATAGDCAAVGTHVGPAGQTAVVADLHGLTLTATPAPLPAEAVAGAAGTATDVTCRTSGWCLALGEATSTGAPFKLALVRNNGTWSAQAAPVPEQGFDLSDTDNLACPADGECTALGRTFELGHMQAVALRLHRGSWSLATLPQAPVPAQGDGPTDVAVQELSCPTVTYCVAVSIQGDRNYPRYAVLASTVSRSHNGTWTTVIAPDLPGSEYREPQGRLTNVTCPSRSSCVIAGTTYFGSYGGGVRRAVAFVLDGSQEPQQLAIPDSATSSYVYKVDCASIAACVVAGHYDVGYSASPGLLYRLDLHE